MGTAVLQRYVLINAIGQGGVSTVYAAVDARRGRRLAVKILAPTLAARACMAKIPEERPRSQEVALMLWQILHDHGVRRPEPSLT
jgi:hypothetical protein